MYSEDIARQHQRDPGTKRAEAPPPERYIDIMARGLEAVGMAPGPIRALRGLPQVPDCVPNSPPSAVLHSTIIRRRFPGRDVTTASPTPHPARSLSIR